MHDFLVRLWISLQTTNAILFLKAIVQLELFTTFLPVGFQDSNNLVAHDGGMILNHNKVCIYIYIKKSSSAITWSRLLPISLSISWPKSSSMSVSISLPLSILLSLPISISWSWPLSSAPSLSSTSSSLSLSMQLPMSLPISVSLPLSLWLW